MGQMIISSQEVRRKKEELAAEAGQISQGNAQDVCEIGCIAHERRVSGS